VLASCARWCETWLAARIQPHAPNHGAERACEAMARGGEMRCLEVSTVGPLSAAAGGAGPVLRELIDSHLQ
jgi:hypothetical protein